MGAPCELSKLLAVISAALFWSLVAELVDGANSNKNSNSTGSRATDSLKLIVVVSRHGNRGANKDYVQDPYPLDDPKYFPYGRNGLTPHGRVEMHNLGKKVRSLYNGFLNTTFHPTELQASSTATDRTVMSGQVFLAGLYPPHGLQVWSEDIPWQPVPLYSNSPDNTPVINSCAKYVVDCDAEKKRFYEKHAANISEIIHRYNEATAANATNYVIWYLWDKLISEDTEGYKLPEWTRHFYPEPFKSLIIKEYLAFYAGTDNIVRFLVGNLFGEVGEVMKNKSTGVLRDLRLQYYSGHDSTILALLTLLGVPAADMRVVMSGSALVLELHQHPVSGDFTVQVLYIDSGSPTLEPVSINIPVCGDPCDLHQLLDNTRHFTNVDFKQECQDSSAKAEQPF